MKLVKYWYLEESFNMMKRLGMREMMSLCDLLVMKNYRKGQFIKTEDQPEDTIFFIKKGQVKIGGVDKGGNETLRYILGKGHIFGESKLMGDAKPDYFAKTQSETQICYISADMMQQLMDRYPRLNNSVTKVSWKKVSRLEHRLNALLYKDAKTRIIDFLRDHLLEYGVLQEDGSYLSSTVFSHSDIAKLTSTSRQTVNNVISNYRKKGLLTYDRKEISMVISESTI